VAGALARLGARRALVVSSADGLDELSTLAADARGRGRRRRGAQLRVTPEDVGLPRAEYEDVAGGPPGRQRRAPRAASSRAVPGSGARPRGAQRGAAIYAAGPRGRPQEAGVRAAEAAIDSGAAAEAHRRAGRAHG
jgi:anthranilate phosphoribosyltransferase